VKRDREWFNTYLPVMKEFWDKVVYFREHIDELPKPEKKLQRTKRIKSEPEVVCEIKEYSDDDNLSE